jgi:hypothetical protein
MLDKLKKEGFIVLDDIFLDEEIKFIEKYFTNFDFPWYFGTSSIFTCGEEITEEHKNNHPKIQEYIQLQHTFFNLNVRTKEVDQLSQNVDLVVDILKKVFNKTSLKGDLLRCKVNLQPRNKTKLLDSYNTPHNDFEFDHHVVLYYVNDADSNTILFNLDNTEMTQIPSKKGRILIFDGNILHTGAHPKDTIYRIVINYDIVLK